MVDITLEIEKLLQFAYKNKLITSEDMDFARNSLLDLFQLDEPANKAYEGDIDETPVHILGNMLDYAYEIGLLEDNTDVYRDLLDAKIMGLLMPRPSEVINTFYQNTKSYSIDYATDEYYKMSKASNYIRTDRIAKNEAWTVDTSYGELQITVNLSKPEKDPKAIALAKTMKKTSYPSCLLCKENVGFRGHLNHYARQNHRIIPVRLAGEQWHFQYSPYVYYNEHCIIFSENHTPMKIGEETFRKMFDFIDQFPHYFVGSNADLPIVGGSILSHDHFQGGKHEFPMAKAKGEKTYKSHRHSSIQVERVDWPMSVVRIRSKDYKELIKLGIDIFDAWKEYSDESNNILAYTGDTPHNTITPIARKRGEYFEFDLVLRNNRTSEEHPDGIFHPHKELHNIKKENIGLIEVMGLAILPGRLQTELEEIAKILEGREASKDIDLSVHKDWINELTAKYGQGLDTDISRETVKVEVGNVFDKVLQHAGVYKRDEEGRRGFDRFMESLGFIS